MTVAHGLIRCHGLLRHVKATYYILDLAVVFFAQLDPNMAGVDLADAFLAPRSMLDVGISDFAYRGMKTW